MLFSPQIITRRKRAASSPSFSPLDLGSKLKAWLDGTDISNLWQDTAATSAVTADTDLVARISDKSGNSKNLLQATSGNRPAYRTSPSRVRFDGTDNYMTIALPAFDLTNIEVYVAFAQHAAKTDFAGLISFAPLTGQDWNSAHSFAISLGNSTSLVNVAGYNNSLTVNLSGTPPAALGVYHFRKTGTTSEAAINNGTPVADNSFFTASAAHTGDVFVGARATNNAVVTPWAPIDLYEIIVGDALSAGDRTSVLSYLYSKHSITP